MKLFIKASLGMALCALLSCVKINNEIGGDLIPVDQRYKIYSTEIPLDEIDMRMADSLSGYSQSRITIGAIKDEAFGLTARESAVTIVPLYDTLNFGKVQKINSFTMTAAFDTISVATEGNERILQRVYVNSLESGIDYTKLTDANDRAGLIRHMTESIVKGTPIIDGAKDLTLSFTDDYAWNLVNKTNGLVLSKEIDKYFEAVPGLYIYTDSPSGTGGRINTFDVQMNYNSSSYYLESNYGELNINTIYDEEVGAIDTSFFFYYGATKFTPLDSLITSYSNGTFPQYAFNLTKHDTRSKAGKATDKVWIEGGAGLKPVVPALSLKHLAEKAIQDTLLAHGRSSADYTKAVINKARIVLPFSMDTPYTELDSHYPPRLSPTCRIWTDTTSTFMGLTDSSMENENKGDINRSICVYSPDITYHLQQILLKDEDTDKGFKTGNYDIWMLLMSEQTTTTSSSSSSSSDMSEYLQYLAYQSYYNSMYGNGSYGYGSSYYSNYYSYLLAAMYASGSSTTTSKSYALDKDAYFKAELFGPESTEKKPTLKLVFSIPEE